MLDGKLLKQLRCELMTVAMDQRRGEARGTERVTLKMRGRERV